MQTLKGSIYTQLRKLLESHSIGCMRHHMRRGGPPQQEGKAAAATRGELELNFAVLTICLQLLSSPTANTYNNASTCIATTIGSSGVDLKRIPTGVERAVAHLASAVTRPSLIHLAMLQKSLRRSRSLAARPEIPVRPLLCVCAKGRCLCARPQRQAE